MGWVGEYTRNRGPYWPGSSLLFCLRYTRDWKAPRHCETCEERAHYKRQGARDNDDIVNQLK